LIAASDLSSGELLARLVRWKSRLSYLIQPAFGLMEELLVSEFLTRRQLEDVCSERTIFRRNDAILELVTSDNQCDKLITALQRTGQQHIINFVTQDGGQVFVRSCCCVSKNL